MKILLSCCDGFLMSESARVIYSGGYTRSDIPKTEHDCLCDIAKLVHTRLEYEGVGVKLRLYNESKQACFQFDKASAREISDIDAAILLALNSSQNSNAQFSTCLIHQQQQSDAKFLFESTMHAMARFIKLAGVPVSNRFPQQLRRIPYLDACNKKNVPALLYTPFFYTDKKINKDNLGSLIESAATGLAEGLLSFCNYTGEES